MRKILVSAYGCEPNKGSEQGVGWHWVLEMARSEELWVITRSNNKHGIENGLSSDLAARIHFIYYDVPEQLRRFKRKEKGLYLYYALWQWGAYKNAKKLATELSFDYCIHLTFGSMWMPTFMHRLPIPFIWGPIGGGESVPSSFVRTLPWRGRIAQYARSILIRSVAFNPLFTGPAQLATSIIARTDDSKAVFPQKYRHKVIVALETGMSKDVLQRFMPATGSIKDNIVRFVYVGRLIAIKNIEAALRAVAQIPKEQVHFTLTIVGDGPLRNSLKELSRILGIADRINLIGAVSQDEAIHILQQSDVFLFPSLKEGGTWSLMEAMAVGLPVICLDTTGMHVITDDICAIRINPTSPEDTLRQMAEAVKLLAVSPELRAQMGTHGRQRIAEHFSWSQKGVFMEDLLNDLDTMSCHRNEP